MLSGCENVKQTLGRLFRGAPTFEGTVGRASYFETSDYHLSGKKDEVLIIDACIRSQETLSFLNRKLKRNVQSSCHTCR